MKKYTLLSSVEIQEARTELLKEYEIYKSRGLRLDLSRGKPNSEQLDFNNALLDVDLSCDHTSDSGIDCRNYGVLDGLPEMKDLFSEILGIKREYITVGGNSSLQLMYDMLSRAMIFGLPNSPRPWSKEDRLKWICVVPGYDRHFRITELFGFEMLTVPMTAAGPDMDMVEQLVKDPTVKGIWCIPKYSNPSGNTYSDETVTRLACMECAAPDFMIMWDNAYAIHDFDENGDTLIDIFTEAEKYGNEDRVFYFSSTSKVTFPGGGVAIVAMSDSNRAFNLRHLGAQTIGYDKLNQLRHIRFLKDAEHTRAHMLAIGKNVKSKFDIVLSALSVLEGLDIAEWTVPRGGYFISFKCMAGTAGRVYSLMRDAGVTLTPAGATHPYGIDPEDSILRIAPTYPSDDELELASHIFTVAVRLAALEKLRHMADE